MHFQKESPEENIPGQNDRLVRRLISDILGFFESRTTKFLTQVKFVPNPGDWVEIYSMGLVYIQKFQFNHIRHI